MATPVININSSQYKVGDKRVQTKCDDFAFSVRPIYFFSRACGLLPFSIIRNSCGEIQGPEISLIDAVWFSLSICAYSAMAYVFYQNLKITQDPSTKSYFLVLGDYMLYISVLLYGVLVRVMDMCNRFKLIDIIKKFKIFDKEMAKRGIYFNYRREYGFVWISIVVITIVSLVFMIASTFIYKLHQGDKNCFVCYLFGMVLIISAQSLPFLSYILLLRNLHERFYTMNSLLRKQFSSINIRKESLIEFIKFTGREHSFLTGIMDQINFCYSFQVMVNTAVAFIYSVLTFYTFYQYFLQKNYIFKVLTVGHYLWESLYFIAMIMGIYVANLVKSEGKNTSYIVHDLINDCNELEITTSLSQLSSQVHIRHPIATCGLFTFDWPLLFTMGAAITTYLTIILNFETIHNASRNRTSI